MSGDAIPGPAGVDSSEQQLQFSPEETNFLSQVQKDIEETASFRELVYRKIPPSLGVKVLDQLNRSPQYTGRKHYNSVDHVLWIRLMPEPIHDVHQKWWHDEVVLKWTLGGHATREELKTLWPGVGSTIKFIHGPYADSRKEPDFYLRADGDPLPRFVIETGWSDSYNRLLHDMNLWLVGGNGSVQAVLLLKWERVSFNRVMGYAELYGLDRNGMPKLIQNEVVFPDPGNQRPQLISLTRRILFGSHLAPEAAPDSTLTLDIADLRVVTTDALRLMGLAPA